MGPRTGVQRPSPLLSGLLIQCPVRMHAFCDACTALGACPVTSRSNPQCPEFTRQVWCGVVRGQGQSGDILHAPYRLHAACSPVMSRSPAGKLTNSHLPPLPPPGARASPAGRLCAGPGRGARSACHEGVAGDQPRARAGGGRRLQGKDVPYPRRDHRPLQRLGHPVCAETSTAPHGRLRHFRTISGPFSLRVFLLEVRPDARRTM